MRRSDIDLYGPTAGCPRCERFARGASGTGGPPHTEECRERIKELVRQSEQDRFREFEERKIGRALTKMEIKKD